VASWPPPTQRSRPTLRKKPIMGLAIDIDAYFPADRLRRPSAPRRSRRCGGALQARTRRASISVSEEPQPLTEVGRLVRLRNNKKTAREIREMGP